MRKTKIRKLARFLTLCLVGTASFPLSHKAFSQDPEAVPPPPPYASSMDSANDSLVPDLNEDPLGGIDGDQAFMFEETEEQIQKSIREQAFRAALDGLLPLRPEEIRALIERYDRTQESVTVPIYPDPKPETVVQTVTMDPGTKPLSIKTAFGHVTTVNFVDVTGEPWPVRSITWAGDFDIMEYERPTSKNEDGEDEGQAMGSNILRITPEKEFARGNISIKMLNLATPIIMTLEASRDIVHYRFDAIVPEYGPFAQAPLIDNGVTLAAGRADVSGLLQGIIPRGASKMHVSGVDGRTSAYKYNGQVYLRTPYNLLSPSWKSSVSAADGTKVYEISDTPVVLLSDKGNMVRAKISDREVILND